VTSRLAPSVFLSSHPQNFPNHPTSHRTHCPASTETVEVTVGLGGVLAVLVTITLVIEGSWASAVDRTVRVGAGAVTVTIPDAVLAVAVAVDDGSSWRKAERRFCRAVDVPAALIEDADADEDDEDEEDEEEDGVGVTVTVTSRSWVCVIVVATVAAEGAIWAQFVGATSIGVTAGQLQGGGWTIIGPRAPGRVFQRATMV